MLGVRNCSFATMEASPKGFGNGSFKIVFLKAQKVRPHKGLSLLGHLERGGGHQEEENNKIVQIPQTVQKYPKLD